MNVTLTRATHKGIPHEPLTWQQVGDTTYAVCANGHIAGLQHDIDPEGNVTPSILCLTSTDGGATECGWHVFAKLEGWPA